MNEANYASLEASKRLAEAGILLETEAGWYKIFRPGFHSFDMVLSMRSGNEKFYGDNYPAPSMAEVWRELPDVMAMNHRNGETECWLETGSDSFASTNPTDALIDLLIFIKGLDVPK
jgi:hypothetical protein